jgi:hypothetical protein
MDNESWWDELTGMAQGLVIFFLILFIVASGWLAWYKFYAPQFADAEKDVYNHTRTYVEGQVRDLNNLCIAVEDDEKSGAGTHKSVLQDTIRNRFVQLDEKDTPDYLRQCLHDARSAAN